MLTATRCSLLPGSDAIGCLYGVYGLLEDDHGLGFYLGGDVLPDAKSAAASQMWTNASGRPWLSAAFFLDQLPPVGDRLLLARLAVHHRSNGQDADELPAHPQLQ